MSEMHSGLYTIKEFEYRRTHLKLAPDAFVVINGAIETKVVSPASLGSGNGKKMSDLRGGITSMDVNGAVDPPGANTATVTIVAPQHKGLHDDYYEILPNGVKSCIFRSMMEIKIYMKCRFLSEKDNYVPQYYPVFWGIVTDVGEDYSGGVFNITLSCKDFFEWWRHQQVTISASVTEGMVSGAPINKFPGVFHDLNPWEIIYGLFTDTLFIEKVDGVTTYRNLSYLKPWTQMGMSLNNSSMENIRLSYGSQADSVVSYWNNRFGIGDSAARSEDPRVTKDALGQIPLEMYGLRGPISREKVESDMLSFIDAETGSYNSRKDEKNKMDMDYGLMDTVKPFSAYSSFSAGDEAVKSSKVEIATKVCEYSHMEFFVDMNGSFVFKPPFYNLDVSKVKHYRIGPEDIESINLNHSSSNIINYLTLNSPLSQEIYENAHKSFHADWDSIKKYGIRIKEEQIPFVMDSDQLRMMAVGEMAKHNAEVDTGSITIPLRPELRLGYPVYIEHLDTYYYITDISHSFTFGTSASTTITIKNKRERIFYDNSSMSDDRDMFKVGEPLRSCVYRNQERDLFDRIKNLKTEGDTKYEKVVDIIESIEEETGKESDADKEKRISKLANDFVNIAYEEESGIFKNPDLLGLWKVDYARDAAGNPISLENINNLTNESISSNELIMITGETAPYTDLKGYRHIGSFPYGANLSLTGDGSGGDLSSIGGVRDMSKLDNIVENKAMEQMYASGLGADYEDGLLSYNGPNIKDLDSNPFRIDGDNIQLPEPKEYQVRLDERKELEEDLARLDSPITNPDLYDPKISVSPGSLQYRFENDRAIEIQLDLDEMNEDDIV